MDHIVEGNDFLILAAKTPQGNHPGLGLALADDQHDGHFGQAVLADFQIDLLVATATQAFWISRA